MGNNVNIVEVDSITLLNVIYFGIMCTRTKSNPQRSTGCMEFTENNPDCSIWSLYVVSVQRVGGRIESEAEQKEGIFPLPRTKVLHSFAFSAQTPKTPQTAIMLETLAGKTTRITMSEERDWFMLHATFA